MPLARPSAVLSVFLGLAALGSLILVVSGNSPKVPARPSDEPAAPVDAPVPVPPSAPRSTPEFVGVILPSASVEVVAQLQGEVQELLVEMGESVREGRVLAVLRSTSVTEADVVIARSELRAAEAEVARLTLQLEQAGKRLTRAELLSQQQLIATDQLEDARYEPRLARAALSSAEAALEQKRAVVAQRLALLSELRVRAAFDGIVSTRYVEKGSAVGPGTALFRLVRTLPLKVRFAVSGADSQHLHLRAPMLIRVEELDATLCGSVSHIAPEMDSASQMVVAEAVVDAENAAATNHTRFIAGRSARVTPATGARADTDAAVRCGAQAGS